MISHSLQNWPVLGKVNENVNAVEVDNNICASQIDTQRPFSYSSKFEISPKNRMQHESVCDLGSSRYLISVLDRALVPLARRRTSPLSKRNGQRRRLFRQEE